MTHEEHLRTVVVASRVAFGKPRLEAPLGMAGAEEQKGLSDAVARRSRLDTQGVGGGNLRSSRTVGSPP